MEAEIVQWRPHKGAQEAFHRSSAFEIGYGGAAGGGKSESLLREALRQIHKPGYKAILFRRTYPELEHSLIERAFEVYPHHGGRPKKEGRVWYFTTTDPHRPAKIIFGHLEHDKDVHKYQSAQFDVIGFDEATSFTEVQYTYMRSRVRGSDPSIQRYMMLATNPGNIGHTWFKKRFIDNKEPFKKYYFVTDPESGEELETTPDDQNGLSRCFIPAKVWDNPTLLKNDPGYVARLKSLDADNRRMLLDGDWDVFKGQFFIEWRRERHVIEPFAIPSHWKRFIGLDYGATAPFATLWVAIDEDRNVYVYREYYEEGKTAKENARNVFLLNNGEDYSWMAVDPSIFSTNHTGETIAEVLMREGLRVMKASNQRIAGWNSIRELLAERKDIEVNGRTIKDNRGQIYVFNNCVNLVRTIPEMIHDQHKPEDLNTDMEDHALDALRYIIQTLRDRKSKPAETAIQKKIRRVVEKDSSFNPNRFYVRS